MKETNLITDEDLAKISKFTRREMKKEDIYTFSVILCDNEIDRQFEKFTVDSLEKIAQLFIGKTGIFDHQMSSKGQTARIYSACVEKDENRVTADGEIYTYVKAKAYMVKTEQNSQLRKEIDAGIKKETSVNCSVGNVKCSVCGRDIKDENCDHIKGNIYNGKKCFYMLCNPMDAYEWSFVAVPAQKNAGVTKGFAPDSSNQVFLEFMDEMKDSVVKDGSKILPSLSSENLRRICDYLPITHLKLLKDALNNEVQKNLPIVSQLASISAEKSENQGIENNREYII